MVGIMSAFFTDSLSPLKNTKHNNGIKNGIKNAYKVMYSPYNNVENGP